MYRGATNYLRIPFNPLYTSMVLISFSFLCSLAAELAVNIGWVPAIVIGFLGLFISMFVGSRTYRRRNSSERQPSLYYWRGVMWVSGLGLLLTCILYMVALITNSNWILLPQVPHMFSFLGIAYGLRTHVMKHEFDVLYPPL